MLRTESQTALGERLNDHKLGRNVSISTTLYFLLGEILAESGVISIKKNKNNNNKKNPNHKPKSN